MLSKSAIKYINALKKKKFRQKYDKFIAEGEKIALEMLKHSEINIDAIYATSEWLDNHAAKIGLNQHNLVVINQKELKTISSLTTPNHVLIVAKKLKPQTHRKSIQSSLSLVLDGIQDPGNMGTIWRIADWFGIQQVFCSENCVDIYNSKVIQSSMGAFLRVPAYELNLKSLFQEHPNIPVYGALLNGESIFTTKTTPNGFILIGNESKGIGEELQSFIHHKIKIPAYGGAESLNAAVAAGIICAVFRK